MTISGKQIYPRTGDKKTIYLKNVITDPSIIVGDYSILYHSRGHSRKIHPQTLLR